MSCINSLESGSLRRSEGNVGVIKRGFCMCMWVHTFGLSMLLPGCLRLLLACSSKNTPGSDGIICSGGPALYIRGRVPDSLTSNHALGLHCSCASFVSAKPPFRWYWLFFKKTLLHSVLWKMDDTSSVPPRVAQWVHGATAAHLGLSAAGRDQIGAGFHGPAGCGWSA